MRIILIESGPPDAAGSMNRYAALLQTALETVSGVECSRVSLAPTRPQLERIPRRLRTAFHHATIAWRARRLVRRLPADIYHVVDGSHGYIARWLPETRTIVTAHDIIPELQSRGRFPLPPPGKGARWIIRASLLGVLESAHVIAVSQATRNDLVEVAGIPAERIHVVLHAVPPELLPKSADHLPGWEERRTSPRPFLLHIGNNGFYKNRLGVVRIFDRLRRDVSIRLKLAGPPPDDSLRSLIASRGLEPQVDFVTSPDDSVVKSLYRDARLLLFPSLYEGFGWPPLEAMAWGCPVVCSSNGSLLEVAGTAALVADASAEEQLAAHCLSILQTRERADELVSIGLARVAEFSIERFRDQMLNVYQLVANRQNSVHAPATRSILPATAVSEER